MRLVGVLWVKEGENIIAQCINTRSLDMQHYRDWEANTVLIQTVEKL